MRQTVLIIVAVVVAAGSLVASHLLVRDLAREERGRMVVWAEAMHQLNTADGTADLTLVLRVLEQNNTIPVVVTDARGMVVTSRNVSASGQDSVSTLEAAAARMASSGRVLRVRTGRGATDVLTVAYDDSLLLRRLAWYPYILLGVVSLLVAIAIVGLVVAGRAEQNKVWVGLSKETAHQLGTPISSLMAWVAILREQYPHDELIPELNRDVERLQLIADRFSKIGSVPETATVALEPILKGVAEYMDRRTPHRVRIYAKCDAGVMVNANRQLLEWVFENLCKNAADAMCDGVGVIDLLARPVGRRVVIDVSDTGHGIDRKNLKRVFRPGFTTKRRGWGLGLSLARRIIEEYHHGRIYVLRSTPGEGTTFRIEL